MPSTIIYPTSNVQDACEWATTTGSATQGDVQAVQPAGVLYFGSPDVALGRSWGIKFPLPSTGWLSGKILTRATVQFRSAAARTTTFGQTLYVEDTATPADFADGSATFSITSRARSTRSMDFGSTVVGNWANGSDYAFNTDGTTLLRDMINEVADRRGRASMTAICLIGIYTSGTGSRNWRNYENVVNIPQLTLEYASDIDEGTVKVLRSDSRKVVLP